MSSTCKKLRKATDKQAEKIIEEARNWFAEAPMSWIFNNCKSITVRSVAEFMANQKGLSLWPKTCHTYNHWPATKDDGISDADLIK